MIKKLVISLLLISLITTNAEAQSHKQIEIFDISKGKVIKRVPLTADIQKDVKHFIKRTTGVYAKIQPIPNNGFIVKVPLEPPVMIHNQWIHGLVDEIFIIFPSEGNPYYMVFDNHKRAYVFTFEGDTHSFLKKLKYIPKSPSESYSYRN